MKLRLVKPKDFSGSGASFYTILDVEKGITPFGEFLKKWSPEYDDKLLNFTNRILSMARKTSALEIYFKLNEGLEYDDLVSALYDEPDKEMRLYCIRMNEKIVILGGGGPKHVQKWQNDPKLEKAVYEMMFISKLVRDKINNGSLFYSPDGLLFKGDLILI